MAGYFNKIEVHIFYPEFDNGYDEQIATVQYQVGYQDLQGAPVNKAMGLVQLTDGTSAANLQLASWRPGDKFNYIGFNFMKPDKPGVELTITRTVYYKPPGKQDAQQISINTDGDDAGKFNITKKPAKAPVSNKVTISIGDIGTAQAASSVFFEAVF